MLAALLSPKARVSFVFVRVFFSYSSRQANHESLSFIFFRTNASLINWCLRINNERTIDWIRFMAVEEGMIGVDCLFKNFGNFQNNSDTICLII